MGEQDLERLTKRQEEQEVQLDNDDDIGDIDELDIDELGKKLFGNTPKDTGMKEIERMIKQEERHQQKQAREKKLDTDEKLKRVEKAVCSKSNRENASKEMRADIMKRKAASQGSNNDIECLVVT